MHVHFFLGLAFLEENLTIVDEVQSRYKNAKFSALVSARSHVMDMLDAKKGTAQEFYRYDWLSALEKKWLETPLDRKKLKKYEDMLGTDTIRRIITADRELAVGLVTCGTVERTKLMDLTVNDDDARWRYILGLLEYIFDFYRTEKPDMVFLYCIAGSVTLAMAEVADYLNIPFSQLIFARTNDYQILDDDPMGMLKPIKKLYKKALKDPSLVVDTYPQAEKYLADFLARPEMPVDTKFWLTKIMKDYSIQGMVKNLLVDMVRWGAILLGLKGTKGVYRQRSGYAILRDNLKKFFLIHYMLRFQQRKTIENTAGDVPFLYFPLHVDPEMSTMVLADKLTDQVAVIERLSKSMPAGYKLLVKEHIPCIGKRPYGFYKRIERLPDVHLISPFNDNFELLRKTVLTVTMTGSAAWESIMMGRPPLILGHVHFTNIGEGFVTCDDHNNLDKAIKEALSAKPAKKESIQTYIATLMKEGFELSMIAIWFGGQYDKDEFNASIKKLVDKMEEIIKRRRSKKIAKKIAI